MNNRRAIPVDKVLNLWAEGNTIRQIIDIIGPVKGAKFSKRTIERVLREARWQGDRRAMSRMVTGPKGSVVLASSQSQK